MEILDKYYFLFLLYWIERTPDEFVERAEKGLKYENVTSTMFLQSVRCGSFRFSDNFWHSTRYLISRFSL